MSAPSVVRLVRVPELADAPYAYAATTEGPARVVALAGACPLDAEGMVTAPGDVAAQAAQCVANLRSALAACDADLGDVLSTRVLVATTEQADLVAAWDVVHAAFADHEVPSTLLGVTVLGYPGQLVEVEATAAIRDA